jgi:hypothetical protein
VLDKKLLAKDVEVPVKPEASHSRAPSKGPKASRSGRSTDGAGARDPGTRTETRCMEIPVVQITPRGDPDDQDPSGRCYIEMAAGAIENNAHLAMSASEVIDKNLHLEGYSSSTSPITGQQREDSRATGNLIPIIRDADKPVWGESIPFEKAFFNFYELADQAIDSIGSANKAAKGQDGADEKSGKAIALGHRQQQRLAGRDEPRGEQRYARWNRIKLERMMCDYTTQQQIAYVGEDGIFKQEDFDAMDFALVGKVTVKAGTGTLLNPDQKTQNLAGLAGGGLLSIDEAKDAARPAFSKRLGSAGVTP